MKLKKYFDYLNDNPKGYWFKRKIYGWGWVPVTWQGWAVILAFILFLTWEANRLSVNSNLNKYPLCVILAILILLVICLWKGEKPKWQWGLKKK